VGNARAALHKLQFLVCHFLQIVISRERALEVGKEFSSYIEFAAALKD